jgi:hypothetical protein
MEEALRSLIVANSGVTALVSTRVYWGLVPQAVQTQSWVRMNRITGNRDNHMQGPSGLVSSAVQVDCVSNTYSGAKLTARAIVAVVNGYRGTSGSMAIQGIFIRDERDGNEAATGDTATRFMTSLDLEIWHPET